MALTDIGAGITGVLNDVADVYGKVQYIRTDAALRKAQASAADFGAPNAYQNPQAKTGQAVAVPGVGTLSRTGLLLAFAAFGVAVWLAVK